MKTPTGRILGLAAAAMALNACGPAQPFPARDGREAGDSDYRWSVDFLEDEVGSYVRACENSALAANTGDYGTFFRRKLHAWVQRVNLFRGAALFSPDAVLSCAPLEDGAGFPEATLEICDKQAGGKWVFDEYTQEEGFDIHFESANRYECPKF